MFTAVERLCVQQNTDVPGEINGFDELFVNASNGVSPLYENV